MHTIHMGMCLLASKGDMEGLNGSLHGLVIRSTCLVKGCSIAVLNIYHLDWYIVPTFGPLGEP